MQTQLPIIDLTVFEREGFSRISNPFTFEEIENLSISIEDFRDTNSNPLLPGVRNLLRDCTAVRNFSISEKVFGIAKSLIGENAKPVRSILFDKTPAPNWYVTWHQDVSIAVAERIDVENYGPWSLKEDVVHVQPPKEILEQMVSLRIHLDHCPEENGAIKFIAGSHKHGHIETAEIAGLAERSDSSICAA
ncbi:MAG: phytanoyl-CoA dioxygenase family protein, partial [Leptolyngbya sp.]|nr:phytanoyl-CoA dioxygenase family protein [Candidatus Melainabacteria bacterium]